MKLHVKETLDDIFGMANLFPEKTGLSVDIWSDHRGIKRNVSHNYTPRLKIGTDEYQASVSISEHPIFLTDVSRISSNIVKQMKKAFPYISRNYDLFLKHYEDVNNQFSDEDLVQSLRERGDYK